MFPSKVLRWKHHMVFSRHFTHFDDDFLKNCIEVLKKNGTNFFFCWGKLSLNISSFHDCFWKIQKQLWNFHFQWSFLKTEVQCPNNLAKRTFPRSFFYLKFFKFSQKFFLISKAMLNKIWSQIRSHLIKKKKCRI